MKFAPFTAKTARALGLNSMPFFSFLVALLILIGWWSAPTPKWWLPPSAALAVLLVTGAVVAMRRYSAPQISYALGIAAWPAAFSTGWVSVPPYAGQGGHWTAANFAAASAAVAGASLLVTRLTRLGVVVHTAMSLSAGFSTVSAAAVVFGGFNSRQVGTVGVLAGMILVSVAPGVALLLARGPSAEPSGSRRGGRR